MIRRVSPLVLVVSLLVAGSPRAEVPTSDQAKAFIESFYQQVDAVVQDAGATPAEKQALLTRLLRQHLDYGTLAASALGKQADSFTRQQFADFSQEYSRFLTDFFLGSIASSQPGPRRILDASTNAETGIVTLRTAGPARKGYIPGSIRVPRQSPEGFVMTYLLRERGGVWRFLGVSFGGVSVSNTFRSQFESFLRTNDADALIAELHKRNVEAAKNNPFVPGG